MEERTESKEEERKPQFLKSIVKPLEARVEMGKLPKMCSCFSYGS